MKSSRHIQAIGTLLGVAIVIASSVSSTLGQGKGGGKNGGKDDGSNDVLPSIRYRLTWYEVPNADLLTNYMGMNDHDQVVGYYRTTTGQRKSFLLDARAGSLVFVDEIIDPESLPSGWTFASVRDINDHGVAVGYAVDEVGAYRAIAVDLAAAVPVVDLLPTTSGSQSAAIGINNAGDILATEYLPSALAGRGFAWELCWTMNPGLYGEPSSRLPRTSESVDLRAASTDTTPTIVDYGPQCNLSESVAGSAAQVAGIRIDGVPFTYTLGDDNVESFPQFTDSNAAFAGVSLGGTFAGRAVVAAGSQGKKTKYERVTYRYNPAVDDTYQLLSTDEAYPQDINRFDEVLVRIGIVGRNLVFRDWDDGNGERLVSLDDLVVGSSPDVALWLAESPNALLLGDSGIIVGNCFDSASRSFLFTLIPESVSP